MSVVTVVPTAEPDAYPPRVRLDVTDTGTPARFTTTVTRLDPDGRTRPVRTFDGGPLVLSTSGSDRIATIYDYEVPYGAPVSYSTVESATVVSPAVTVTESRVWLISVVAPALSLPITVANIGPRGRDVARAVYRPMGRKSAIVHTDGQRKSPEYDLTVRTHSLEELQALNNLCDDAQVLLFNVPARLRWGIGAEYVSVGRLVENRLYPYGPEERRHWDLPCIVTDRPEGGTTATRTLAVLAAEAPTLAGLAADYPTSLYDMAAG